MTWPDTPVRDYMEWLSRPTPRWAGGAAAAMTGASGWALLAMTFGIIQRKYPELGIQDLIDQAVDARDELLALAESDVLAVRALAHDSTGDALIEATRVPLAMCKLAAAGSRAARHPARSRLPQAEPDFGTAEALFAACQRSTRLIVTANLSGVREPERTRFRMALEAIPAE